MLPRANNIVDVLLPVDIVALGADEILSNAFKFSSVSGAGICVGGESHHSYQGRNSILLMMQRDLCRLQERTMRLPPSV